MSQLPDLTQIDSQTDSNLDQTNAFHTAAQSILGRRRFLSTASLAGLGLAATTLTPSTAKAQSSNSGPYQDTVKEILTAVLIAEDLATTFYYNSLVGAVIQDPNLAGPGGSATNVTPNGNLGNVEYIQAALSEEISHANLARTVLGGSNAASDPYQTFYFPAGSFDTLAAFTGLLDALENAFIGAYLTAIQILSAKAAVSGGGTYTDSDGAQYSAANLTYFVKIAASIMGVECEHRVLGRVISNTNPANNLAYEQTDGLGSVYNGPNSAVVALTPFLTPSTGPAYSLATALANQGSVSLPVTGNPPASL